MHCPHCGAEQPISDTCRQCGEGLLSSEPIHVTVEVPSAKGPKILFMLSLGLALVGGFWIYEGAKAILSVPPAPVVKPSPEKIAPAQTSLSEAFVIAFTKVGGTNPQMVRQFEQGFSGKMKEISLEGENIPAKLNSTQPQVLLSFGMETFESIRKSLSSLPQYESAPHIVITSTLTEGNINGSGDRVLFFQLRPDPGKVIRAAKGIFQLQKNKILAVYDPQTDKPYLDLFYTEALKENFEIEIIAFKNVRSFQEKLKNTPSKDAIVFLFETPLLTSREAINVVQRFVNNQKIPLVAVGNKFGVHGASLVLQISPPQIGAQLVREVKKINPGTFSNAQKNWLYADGLAIEVYGNNAPAQYKFQLARQAEVFRMRNANIELKIIN